MLVNWHNRIAIFAPRPSNLVRRVSCRVPVTPPERSTWLPQGALCMFAVMVPICGASFAQAQSIFPVPSKPAASGASISRSIEVQGRVDARCRLTLEAAVQSINVSMVDADGRINAAAFQAAIVGALNQAGLKGWCSGANNQLVLTRTPFVLGTDGTPVNGFARAVLFDVSVSVSTPTQSYSDATQDGPSVGSSAGRFGPTGIGAALSFAASISAGALTQPVPIIAATSLSQGATASFTQLIGSRLVAGTYASSVTLEVRPGL